MVESLMPGRSTCCAQPASMMTRARRSSSVAAVPGPLEFRRGGSTAGASSIMAASSVEAEAAQRVEPRAAERGELQRQTEALGIGQHARQELAHEAFLKARGAVCST